MDSDLEDLESRITARPRDIVRLFQCPKCEKIIKDPVATPCGRHACLSCVIPDPRTRVRWERTRSDASLVDCPFAAECGKSHNTNHIIGDSEFCIALNLMEDQLSCWRGLAARLGLYARVSVVDAGGIPASSTRGRLFLERPYRLGKLLAIWDLATFGILKLDGEVIYSESPDPKATLDQPQDVDALEWRVLRNFQKTAWDYMTCKLCSELIQDPATAVCGHAFCRSCLCLAMQTSSRCPLCLLQLSEKPDFEYQEPPSCRELKSFVETFYMDEQLVNLRARFASLDREWEKLLLLPCRDTIPMPHTAARLHIKGAADFYLPTMKRAIAQDRVLGVVQVLDQDGSGEPIFRQFGTLVHIRSARWRGENYEAVVDCISVFKIYSYTTVHNFGITFAVTKPIQNTIQRSTPEEDNLSTQLLARETRERVWKMISSPV